MGAVECCSWKLSSSSDGEELGDRALVHWRIERRRNGLRFALSGTLAVRATGRQDYEAILAS